MILTTEERTKWITDFLASVDFITPVPTSAEVGVALDRALLDIPETCKKKDEILYALTIHNLLQLRIDKEKTKKGDLADLKEIRRVGVVGDVNTEFFKGVSDGFNPDYDSTFWGAKAKRMLKSCKKSRIGLIY